MITLNRNTLFKRAYARGQSTANKYMAVYVLKNRLPYNRFGITVTKKIGKAVVRNRVRRIIKESIRLNQDKFKQGYDIVFVARYMSIEAKQQQVQQAMLNLLRGKNLILETEEVK